MLKLLDAIKNHLPHEAAKTPCEFFAALWHFALPETASLIDQDRNMSSVHYEFADEIRYGKKELEGRDVEFPAREILHDFIPKIRNETQARIFFLAMLFRMDNFIQGDEINRGYIDRLRNIDYYKPIKIEGSAYIITPKIAPLFKPNIPDKLRKPDYFNSVLNFLLTHHTIVKEDDFNNPKIFMKNLCNGMDDSIINRFHQPLMELKSLTLGLAPLDESFEFEADIHNQTSEINKVFFTYSRIKRPLKKDRRVLIERIVKDAIKRHVDILIFPELAIDHNDYTELVDILAMENSHKRIKLIVAGSFHKERQNGGYTNTSIMLDWQGDILWEQHKLNRFEMQARAFKKSPNAKELRKSFGLTGDCDLVERIHTDYPVVFVDTPIGRMATLICLDFIHGSVESVLLKIPCDYLWSPAMTPDIEAFEASAQNTFCKKLHILSACCVSKSLVGMMTGETKELSFVSVPWKKKVKKWKADELKNSSGLLVFTVDNSKK